MSTSPLFEVAYRDEHLLVIDKAPGLVVHPARGHREGTLAQLLAAEAAGGEDPMGLVLPVAPCAHQLLEKARALRAELGEAMRELLVECFAYDTAFITDDLVQLRYAASIQPWGLPYVRVR